MRNPVIALLDAVAPPALGPGFRRLLGAAIISNIGDGVALAAGPLLVASQTHDPFLVSLALFCQHLPALVFGWLAGAVVDRVDRQRLVVLVNLGRALILGLLAATIVSGVVNIAVVLGFLLVLGTVEIFADLGTSSWLPRLVPRTHLGIANARLQGAYLLTNELLGPPIGAALFVIGMALPFATNAVAFALGAVLVARIVAPRPAASPVEGPAASPAPGGAPGPAPSAVPVHERASIRADMVEGFRWLRSHPPMRTLAITIILFNVTYGAAWAVLVLYARDQLGMDSIGFGLLSTAIAIGGIIGTVSYGWLERHFSLANIMRVGLLIETFTHLALALTTVPIVAMGVLVVFGAHAFVWGTTSTTVRQRAVPDELLGRVGGLYVVGVVGGIVVGTPIGGLLARSYGITAPFWFGFIGSALLVAVMWRQFDQIVHAGDAGRSAAADLDPDPA